jgi:hypothetical protein
MAALIDKDNPYTPYPIDKVLLDVSANISGIGKLPLYATEQGTLSR